ncbi:MAG: transaldolase family protein [Oligoflexia bacterium]|nr:transaldolase family protein [Oligoflexia bacterium]
METIETSKDENKKPLAKMHELGCEFWNDSADLAELENAVAAGATGATSNPVIVQNTIKAQPEKWNPVIAQINRDYPMSTEDEMAWLLIEEMGRRAAKVLEPVYIHTKGERGFLSLQLNPKNFRDAERMVLQGKQLSRLAMNIAIKAPVVPAGIQAMEELTAQGINVNATVCFSVSQAVEVARAIERGFERAKSSGVDTETLQPYITIMVGRLDDHIGRVIQSKGLNVDPGIAHWAGIAVFKQAYRIFKREGFKSRLLVAAYRHNMHWTELMGPQVTMTIPYGWWTRFNETNHMPLATIEKPVSPPILDALYNDVSDFRLAYDEDAMGAEKFLNYGATVHTLNQFLGGYEGLVQLIRQQMIHT